MTSTNNVNKMDNKIKYTHTFTKWINKQNKTKMR